MLTTFSVFPGTCGLNRASVSLSLFALDPTITKRAILSL